MLTLVAARGLGWSSLVKRCGQPTAAPAHPEQLGRASGPLLGSSLAPAAQQCTVQRAASLSVAADGLELGSGQQIIRSSDPLGAETRNKQQARLAAVDARLAAEVAPSVTASRAYERTRDDTVAADWQAGVQVGASAKDTARF
jgi:hypothetical protein